MLSVGILDANARAAAGENFIDSVVSVVGLWLKWELQQAGVPLADARRADVLFLVHAGQVDWSVACRRALKRTGLQPDAARRGRRPYILTGGPVDAAPFTALKVADALAVGEAYLLVRQVLDLIKAGGAVEDLAALIIAHPHALERSQLTALAFDPARPWRLAEPAPQLASPDPYIDWDGTPTIRSDDKVARVIASKGCHLKCKFCATTYRQDYQVRPDPAPVLEATRQGQRTRQSVALITNDAAALPFFDELVRDGNLAFQSLTVKALRDPDVLRAVCRSGLKVARFGVEGLSERIRQAFGKPVPDDELLAIIEQLHAHKINTHLFFIVGAPYETEADYDAWRQFNVRLARTLKRGFCRQKLTVFTPCPPTPLAYLLSPDFYYGAVQASIDWLLRNWKSRHMYWIPPRKPANRLPDLADSYGATPAAVATWLDPERTVDLAPTLADAAHMPWEVIAWPLSCERRWRLSRSYIKLMTDTPAYRASA